MLEHFVELPSRLQRLRNKPLSKHIDGLAARLHQLGYTRCWGQRILGLIGKFNTFALSAGVESPEQIDESLVKRFIQTLTANGVYLEAPFAMRHMLEYLRDQDVIPKVVEDHPADLIAPILSRYGNHLSNVRGLTPSSCSQYMKYARMLLAWFQNRYGERPLTELTGVDILEFITELAGLHPSGSWNNNLCSLTRVFLRYMRWEGIIESDLARMVPKVACWRLRSIPRHLPWELVRRMIDSIDTSNPLGLRDKAVLLIISMLGLRNQEVRNLQLDHIWWRKAEIRIARTKTRRERALPLPKEVGEAIAEYVLRGRPPLGVPQVFLRHRAPLGPITSTDGIGGIVRKHLLRAGIRAPSYGAHLLRHSLATRMVNQSVPIKQIADVLGHQSIDTTAIYTKVDMRNLSAVALPFPGGEA